MSASTGSTLNNVPLSVIVKPPPHILAGNSVKIPAVVQYGPMPASQAPPEVHGLLQLVDAATDAPINDDRSPIAKQQGHLKTAVTVHGDGNTSFLILFHDITFPKSGTYKIAISVLSSTEDENGIPQAIKLGDVKTGVVNVGQVGGNETHTAEEQGVINMLASMGVKGAR
ncbi:unnamed protein product [Sordaria macrospora k-hell]|uniref:WGS project CABT00000000 data, contig 2.101 n=2 Tax=Sordaria macrospora TaxID=5147 RepID=F7WC82_SORMK|nr:uncharacterized protein SMAC_09568 [Sordaria macrospora k-hell]KAH7631481.1 hypothetical protein B0T09DRAFT_104142 [Sordaria sp. MPI-SDFR-AT-0083]CCC05560.1 unnamed protein product [Sordaria macrospora k-hell]